MGFRYRLHRRDLPGKPDLVFPARRKVIFVHGCFWHSHSCRRGFRVPKSNMAYWGFRNGRAKSDGSEPVEFEWAVVARFVQAVGLIDFAPFSRLTG